MATVKRVYHFFRAFFVVVVGGASFIILQPFLRVRVTQIALQLTF